jgi:cytochrome c5
MKNTSVLLACVAGALALLPLCAQPLEHKASSQAPPAQSKPASSPAEPSPGERAFKQNCSRCHDAPQSFSPRISGTVIRHMRVRASLSEQDEKAILRFLNP